MPAEDLWPVNKQTWDYLDGNAFHSMTTKYDAAISQYGVPKNIEDYSTKGQMAGAVAYRGIWENWNYNKYEFGDRFASGVLFWYHNSPVRQVCSRMWDWSLEPTAALYFSQDALEPLHPQFDFIKNTVSIYNDFYKEFQNLRVRFRLIDMNMKTVIEKEAVASIGEDAVTNDVLKIDIPEGLTPVHFIKLELFDARGTMISDAFYWRSTSKYPGPWTVGGPLHGGFEDINKLPETELDYTLSQLEKDGKKYLTIYLKNSTSKLAFFTRIKLLRKSDNKLIRPVFYSDNYFSILPGEIKNVTVEVDLETIPGNDFEVVMEGFNMKAKVLHAVKDYVSK
jgi:mannosylglycoprotein endo-beta-mannosidase